MTHVPADWLGLTALVFLLGLRHGFDPDHLVAIDGLTRSNRSRWNGLFFSLGHGMVVTLVGLVVALAATEWQGPRGPQELGARDPLPGAPGARPCNLLIGVAGPAG